MSSSALNVLSGIAAAAAGLAGEKVPKSGVIPGLDLASILPALLGSNEGGGASKAGALLSAVSKSGLLKNVNIAELAGSLLSIGSSSAGTEKKSSLEGIAGLASMIAGNTGSGANLGSIAAMALQLAGTAKNNKGLTSMAGELGKTLSSQFGISLAGAGTTVKALDKVVEKDTKSDLFKAILKGLG